jgi:hypothetical protein
MKQPIDRTDYISRKEVMQIIEDMWRLFDDDFDQMVFRNAIKSLPALLDKSSQIREMIERKLLKEKNSYDKVYFQCYQELLDEIDLLNSSKLT